MNYIQVAMSRAAELIRQGYEMAVQNGALPGAEVSAVAIEIPKDSANGDYATSFAMQMARALKMSPRAIADAVVKHIENAGDMFSSIEIAGAGFINFRLASGWYSDVIRNIEQEKAGFGRQNTPHPEKIMVEFVSANPTGPMHMGNARGGVLGDCLAEVLSRAGNEVYREFLINDAGNQIELFGRSLEARYIQHLRGEDAAEFPEDGYHGEDITALAKAFADMYGDRYLQESEGDRRAALITFGLFKNISRMKTDLKRYQIEYDRWFSETELHRSGYIKETIDLLKSRGATYESDGALWLKTTDFGCEKDDVLMRQNGYYTYFAADIAYHRDKFEKRGFDRVINIWGADHHGHVARLKAALDALGLDGSHRLIVILMQLVRLVRDGEVVRMSKRTGKAITLSDLLDEIPVDAARFFFNSRSPETHLEFDLGLAVRNDSENPVYYVQYAHARIMSILRNLEESGIAADPDADLNVLDSIEERALIKQLSRLPEEIFLASRDYDPSRLNRYVIEVAALFHKFYTEHRIKDAEEPQRSARIRLCRAVNTVIANTLSVIRVSAPDRM